MSRKEYKNLNCKIDSTTRQARFKKKDSHFSVNWNVTVF